MISYYRTVKQDREFVQVRVTKYSDIVRINNILHKLEIIKGKGIDLLVAFKINKDFYIRYCLNDNIKITFAGTPTKDIKDISVEKFLENIKTWELLKQI